MFSSILPRINCDILSGILSVSICHAIEEVGEQKRRTGGRKEGREEGRNAGRQAGREGGRIEGRRGRRRRRKRGGVLCENLDTLRKVGKNRSMEGVRRQSLGGAILKKPSCSNFIQSGERAERSSHSPLAIVAICCGLNQTSRLKGERSSAGLAVPVQYKPMTFTRSGQQTIRNKP